MGETMKYYAFALNEYRYKKISFSVHNIQLCAERAAYKASGQAKYQHVRSGDRCAESDLYPFVFDEKEFLKFIKESNYKVDYKNKVMIYEENNG